jgi:ABC-type antimicrobial peptide transport system permease subunit
VVTVGWLLSSDTPFSDEEIAALRSAATGGAVIETLAPVGTQSKLRTVFAVVGMLVGLSVLGATVTLIRSESADDDRVLDVLGATGKTRRSIAGATAGLLALGGAVLAAPLSLVGLIIARAAFRSGLPFTLPWSTIVILFVVFPALAAFATGLSTGGFPRWRSRVAPSQRAATGLAGELS